MEQKRAVSRFSSELRNRSCSTDNRSVHPPSYLASVSDDQFLMMWDPFRHRRLSVVRTTHVSNIFAVKFVPQSGDRRLATGAAEGNVLVHDVERDAGYSGNGNAGVRFSQPGYPAAVPFFRCRCHTGRVKSVAVAPDNPNMLWSSGEDGMIW